MKKYTFIFISLCISTLCAWSVWEGNGVAGATTDFQEDGMFVKSSLFPKYTLIEIVNLENDIKARAIVLEGKEIPGILMSFSPSVAEALKVKYGEVTRIRISSPSLTSDDISSSLYLPKEETSETSKLAMKEEENEKPSKNEEPSVKNEKEIVLYDFNPIAKPSERIEKKDGIVSFDPAFIEEDVKLDLHIPETKLAKKEEPPVKKVELPKPESVAKVEPIKTIGTPKKPIYLENTSLRPPKEVPPIAMLETKSKNTEPVKDVMMLEKKKREEPRLFIKVDEVPSIKEPEKAEFKREIAPVGEVKETREKSTEKKPEEIAKVQEASQIKTPTTEEKKEEIAGVKEVDVPKHEEEEEKDVILPSVIEIPQVAYAPDEEKEIIEPVITIGTPQKMEEKSDEAEPVAFVEEPASKEEMPKEEEQVEKTSIVEEPEETMAEQAKKELDENPLSEISVENAQENMEEEPSKETTELPEEKDIEALERESIEENVQKEEIKKIEETKPIERAKPIEKTQPIEKEAVVPFTKNEAKEEKPIINEKSPTQEKPKNKKESFSTGKTIKNASYVQIAVYGSALAVEELLKKYSGQYPIVVEKKEDSSGVRYIVSIGPLKKDELGAIQERFKSFGFEDCFLK